MINQNIHRIQKHAITLAFQNEAEAISWNRYATEFHQNQMLPALNAIFDEMVPPNKFVSIDKLEVDLGRVSLPELVPQLMKVLKEKLADADADIDHVIHSDIPENDLQSISNTFDVLKKYKVDHVIRNAPDIEFEKDIENEKRHVRPGSKEVLIVDDQQHLGEFRQDLENPSHAQLIAAFIYFIKNGVLPWNSPAQTIADLQTQLLTSISNFSDFQKSDLRQVLTPQQSRSRLFAQFSFQFRNQILPAIFQETFIQLASIRDEAEGLILFLSKKKISNNYLKKYLSETNILHWVISRASSRTDAWPEEYSAYLFRQIFRKNQPVKPEFEKQLLKWISNNQKSVSAPALFLQYVANWSTPAAIDKVGEKMVRTSRPAISQKNVTSVNAPTSQTSKAMPTGQTAQPGEPTPKTLLEFLKNPARRENPGRAEPVENELPDYYYLTYAGVILTWAYLPVLFGKLSYLHGNQFKTKKTQHRAVHLLGYMASGRPHQGEPDLLIAKILCGLGPGVVLPGRIRLKKAEKEEAEVMLQNLISNWSILKNTSVEGLQSSFFARDGKLIREENRWKLIVEQKSFDMVLDHLPYPVSMIRLPWMEEILTVDWM